MDEYKVAEYSLEVYEPGSRDTVLFSTRGPVPLAPIQKGDLLEPGFWPQAGDYVGYVRATQIYHIIWKSEQTGKIAHKVCVYTEHVAKDANIP